MIKAVNISFSYSTNPLYRAGTFSIATGMKVGVVGNNGAGKSTLFKLITREESPDEGKLHVEGSVASVPQEVKHDPALDASAAIRSYIDPEGKKTDHELKKMLAGIELKLDLKSRPQSLSGGQKTRLAILRALIMEPDILLLDEPTNFLDVRGKKWVMNFLSNYPNTLLLISHDMELIDRRIDKVIAINQSTKSIDEQTGSYSEYLKHKKLREELLKREIINEQKHIQRMKKGLLKMARFTSEKGVRRRTQLKRRIERLEDKLPEMPKDLKNIKFSFPEPARVGELPIVAKKIFKAYNGLSVLDGVSISFYRGERVAIIGPNGAGKTTFIKILMGLAEPDSGTIIKDELLDIGYYSQEKESFSEDQTVLEMMEKHAELPNNTVRRLLSSFLFDEAKVQQKISSLSGGEKTRLSIARLLSKNHNMLILDEPTTYLDVMSQRIILEGLKKYKGTLLIVSHTEGFIQELEPDRVLLLPENKLKIWTNELLTEVTKV